MGAPVRKRKNSVLEKKQPYDGETDELEFGGSLGAAALMIGFPLLMWSV